MRPQRIWVAPTPNRRGKAWVVRWRVEGRNRSRSHRSKALADRFRRQLLNAVDGGERFDPGTGEPESWTQGDRVVDFACRWLSASWQQWEPRGRRDVLDATTRAVLALCDAPVPDSVRPHAVEWLQRQMMPGRANGRISREIRQAGEWLRIHSLRFDAINRSVFRSALRSLSVNEDGSPSSSSYLNRKKTGLTRLIGAAVEEGLMAANPAYGVRVPTRQKPGIKAVPRSEIPTVNEARLLMMSIAQTGPTGRRMVAYLATTLYGGLRPCEANAVRLEDLDLPDVGWGLIRVRASRTQVGSAYTDDGEAVSEGPVKARAEGSVREVPLHPAGVALVRKHLELWPVEPGQPVFTNSAGGLLSANIARTLDRARTTLGWMDSHRLAGATHYSFRHTYASTLLDAGVAPPKVAERLGHSLSVLYDTYAHVINKDLDRDNELAEAAFI